MADPKTALEKVISAYVTLEQVGIKNLPKPQPKPEVKPSETKETPKPTK